MLDRTKTISNDASDGIGPAMMILKPKENVPGHSLTKHGGQTKGEPQTPSAAASPASYIMKPNELLPGPSSLRGRKAARQTNARLKPITAMSGDSSIAGQVNGDAHAFHASNGRRRAAPKISDGRQIVDPHALDAVAGDDHLIDEAQNGPVIADHIQNVAREIQPLWRQRQTWHRAEKSLTLQIKGMCRGFVGGSKVDGSALHDRIVDGDTTPDEQPIVMATLPLLCARNQLEPERLRVEKQLERLAKSLPVWPWVKGVYGVGAGTLAGLVGETTNFEQGTDRIRTISDYSTVSKLWKRMGGAVINGERQRRKTDKDAAAAHGFDPGRGAVLRNLGGGLIGGMGKGVRPRVGEDIEARDDWSPYQKMFVRLLRLEVTRVTETWNGAEQAREPVERKGVLYESFGEWATNRIRRRVAKQFLCDFLVAWRRATVDVEPKRPMPAATSSAKAERSANLVLKPINRMPSATTAAAEAVRGGHGKIDNQESHSSPLHSAKADKPRATFRMEPIKSLSGESNSGKPERRGATELVKPAGQLSRATIKQVAAKVARRKASLCMTTKNVVPSASLKTAEQSAGRRTAPRLKPTSDLSAAILNAG